MEIRAAGLPPALPDRIAATGPPAPDGNPLPEAEPEDAIELAIIDGILVRGDGGRERVTLRLLPPALDEDPGDGVSGGGLPGHSLAARVVGAPPLGGSAAGALLLETALGTIAPNPPFAATPGTTLRLDVVARTALPSAGGAASAPSAAPASDIAGALAALPEAVGAGDDLAASLLLLLAAMPGGRERLGEALDRRAPSRAGYDTRRVAAAGDLGWWRASLMPWPLPVPGGAHLLRRVRRKVERNPEEAGSDAEVGVRVVLEIALGRWGRIQLDGLYRRRRFDLVLRSHVPLAAGIREEAGRRFRTRLLAGGLSGGLAFAVTRDFPVSAAPSAPALSLEV